LQIIKAEEWASGENAEAMLTYLGQVYYAFRGEIPHLKHNKTIVSDYFPHARTDPLIATFNRMRLKRF
jgi:hypothetical protein